MCFVTAYGFDHKLCSCLVPTNGIWQCLIVILPPSVHFSAVWYQWCYYSSLCFSLSASADDDQAFGTGKGSGKWPGPADRKPESEPCQRGSLHLETSACLSVSTARPGDLHRRNVITVGNDHQTSMSAFIHLPPGDTWDQPDYTVIFRGFSVCLFV